MNNSLIILKSYLLTFLIGALFIGSALLVSNVLADTASTSVEVGNATPVVSAVNVSPDPIVPTEATTVTVTITATVSDSNGCNDVFASGSISAVLYRSSVSGGANCTANALNCYRDITLSEVDNTCTGGSDTSGDASGTVAVWYFADSTNGASSTFPSDTWQAEVKAVDASNASSTATDSTPPELNVLTALDVEAAINYGTLAAGTTSTLSQIGQSTTTITNTGNSTLDNDISGTDMTSGGNTIAANNQKFATSSVGYDSLTYTLSTTAQTIQFNLVKATTSTSSSTVDTYWGINVPNGQANGIYTGTSTFTAIWSN